MKGGALAHLDGFAMIHELSDEAWQRALAWNLNSTFWATRRAVPHMLPNRWGRVIAISSVEGKQATKAMVSHYITNKHAINGFVKAVAYEYGPSGITSNAICPGAVETDTMRTAGAAAADAADMSYEDFLAAYAEDSMIKRLNTAEEVAAMAVLLASDAGAGITGALIGHFQIRNRATVGGSLAHSDPAAEYPAVALALDGQIEVASAAARGWCRPASSSSVSGPHRSSLMNWSWRPISRCDSTVRIRRRGVRPTARRLRAGWGSRGR